ncbi:MAG: tetratricopeptide repeat protein [Lapillicoccus sp.]
MTAGMPGAHPAAPRAERLLDLRRPDEALALLGPALAERPDDAALLTSAAYAWLLKGDDGQAATMARRASAADPHDDRALRIQASALLHLGDAHQAAGLAYRAVQLAPHAHITHLLYARCLGRIPGAHEQAWAEAMRTVELAPNDPSAHVLVAELAYPAENVVNPYALDIAEDALQHALRLDPQNSTAMNDLARVRLRRSRRIGAMSGFSDALTADPHNETALHNTGVVLGGFLRPAHWMILGATVVSLMVQGPGSGAAGRILQGGLALGVVGVVAWVVVRVRRAVPRRSRVFLREFARHNGWAVAWAGCLALAVLLLLAGPVLPEAARATAVGLALVSVTGGVLCSWVWVASRRRR